MAAAAASASGDASPLVHAVGGSIGSALALLLFYPLERARIELQSRAASAIDLPERNILSVDGQQDGETTTRLVATKEDDDDASASSWMSLDEEPKKRKGKTGQEETIDTPTVATTTPIHNKTPLTSQLQLSLHKRRRQQFFAYWSRKSKLVQVLMDLRQRGQLYKGMTPIITTIFTSQFIFFFLHAYVKRLLLSMSPLSTKSSSAVRSLVSSCVAGIGNVLLTNPLWVTNMAIVTGETETQNLLRELVHLYQTQGLAHLWDGTSASILLVSNPIIQFFCYEQFKQARLRRTAIMSSSSSSSSSTLMSLGALEAFLIAALAKGIATVSTYPLQLAQTLLRLKSNNSNNNNDDDHDNQQSRHVHHHQQYKGTVDCLIQLYKTKKSVAAWFTGMRAKLLQTVLTAAFTFLTYEQILRAVQAVAVMQKVRTRSGGINIQ
jgi:solute carrier family 25 (peroxisomal adenine nucleotide transporter), member 17